MSIDISKSVLSTCGDFIAQAIIDHGAVEQKINNCEYALTDLVDCECMDYTLSGMFTFLNAFELKTAVMPKGSKLNVDIKTTTSKFDFDVINIRIRESLNAIRKVQIDLLKRETEDVFDNEYISYIGSLLFLYYFYGIKIMSSFMKLNVNGRYDVQNVLEINADPLVIKEELEATRRNLSEINTCLKTMIEAREKIKVMESRIETLGLRVARLKMLSFVSDKTYKVSDDAEDAYLKHRISFLNTENIKFRNEIRTSEEKLQTLLKKYLNDYLGVVDNGE